MEEKIYNIATFIAVISSILYILVISTGVPSYDNSYIPELGTIIAISTLVRLFLKQKNF